MSEEEKAAEKKGGKGKLIIILLVLLLGGGGAGAYFVMGGKKAKPKHAAKADAKGEDEAGDEGDKGDHADKEHGDKEHGDEAGGDGEEEGDGEGEHAAESGGHEGKGNPGVLALEPFIVNLQVKGSFLKATVNLQLKPGKTADAMEGDTPKIRDAIIRVLSAKNSTELLAPDGKEKLREELKTSANTVLKGKPVKAIYFTDFIIQ